MRCNQRPAHHGVPHDANPHGEGNAGNPEGSDILFLTNAAYIQNFDKTPTSKSANPDLIVQCIEEKKRHNSVGVKIVQYHKSPLLIETHDRATEAMAKTRKEFHQKN